MVLINRIVAFLGCGALLLAASVLTAPTASATVTTLCTGYAGCARAGMSDSGYGAANRTMYWRMYAGHNCTNYAAYRMVRSGLANSRPWAGDGNATNWGIAMHGITNGTPMVGAVAWWKAGVKPAGSAGHVAYVERVVSANEIIVSMDSWHGDFSWARITRTTSGWPSGFVHFNDVKLRATVVPKVTGTAKVGSVLTASAGTWTPAPTTLGYQWLANGVAISGATGTTFTPTATQIGKQLTVRVTAAGLGYPTATALSTATAAVLPGVMTHTTDPQVVGVAKVGETLQGVAGTWTPAPDGIAYQWLADGTPLPGSDASTLDVGADLLGKSISLQVTATKAGYPAVVATSAALDPVAPGTLAVSSTPAVAGTARPGQLLHLVLPAVTPAPAVAIQWYRNGVPVAGATGATYQLGAGDLGTRVLARLRLTRDGYTPATVATASSPLVRVSPTLQVSATPGVGRLAVTATVRAPGVPPLQGVLRVRSRGGFERELTIRNGVVRTTLTGVPAGTRTFRFRVLPSSTLTTVMVAKRATVR
ncbi:MAG: CHAP domain-containing protein [Marmoricola sp.]|nr:CHAP domain-containing protein [Marmoricola sp.]